MGCLFFVYSFMCFVLLISRCFSSSFEHHICSPTEASALLQFKKSFEISDYSMLWCDRASFPKTKSWNESRDCCSWDGVTCDMLTGHVIGLDLSCSQLDGSIHPNSSLFQLHHLHTLNLAYNSFYPSTIPNGIGHLRNLRHLNLSNAYFDGKIPAEISYLSNLVSLQLYGNDCELDERTFETMVQNLTNLEVLSLSGVSISAPIPVNMSSSLRYVNLGFTNMQGVLTESFFLMPNLETLYLWSSFIKEMWNNSTHLKMTRMAATLIYVVFLYQRNVEQFNTFENDSYGGNIDLCGLPLSKKCGTSDPSHAPQPLESEEDEDESYFFSGFTWESVVIGYSFGLLVGTVMWSLMFKYRKPKCFVEFFEGIFPQKMRRPKKRRLRQQI